MEQNAFPVLFGRVAFVADPVVNGVLFMQFFHVFVPVCFGQNGGCRDSHVFPVPFYDAMVFDVPVGFEPVAVNQNMFRSDT